METFMRALLLLILPLALIICPLAQYLAPEAPPPTTVPTPTPTAAATTGSSARIDLTASTTSLRVGETVTLTGKPVGIGLPYYTLTLSSGASVTVTYDNQVRESLGANAQFELVSASGSMNEVTFVLRALAPGSVDASISATGEVKSAEGAFMWGYGGSAPVTLTITE
jgi:FtsP/CotA-like multicopper oxidase with cupredoxin domain